MERFDNKEDVRKNHRDNGFGNSVAVVLVIAGVVLLGFNLGWFPYSLKSLIVSWQMFLIVLGAGSLARRNTAGGLVMIFTGVFFMLPKLSRLFPELFGALPDNYRLYWPVILIVVGVLTVLKRASGSSAKTWREHASYESGAKADKSNYVDKNLMFNYSEQIVFSDDFMGGQVNVMFGEMKLDLRKAGGLNGNNFVSVSAMFGSTIIYLPEGWEVNVVKESVLFGSLDDKRHAKGGSEYKPTLNLKCSCLFGSVVITN